MKKILAITIAALSISGIYYFNQPIQKNSEHKKIVAIANYGPHHSLDITISGIKDELKQRGYEENIEIVEQNVNFDSSLIRQMLVQLLSKKPEVLIAITTPVAQTAATLAGNTPTIFVNVTDPIAAGIADKAIGIVSDKQDSRAILKFAKSILPNATRVGFLYSTSESNDIASRDMLIEAAKTEGFQVVALAVDAARDIPIVMQQFAEKVDFIYVGASGPIQPSLPAIASTANKLSIPIINMDEDAVSRDEVLASFAVSYPKIGKKAGQMVANILDGNKASQGIYYPSTAEHEGRISDKLAQKYGVIKAKS